MATNTVNQVLQAEKKADDMVANARQIANATVEDARVKAEQVREQIFADARKKAEELTAKIQLDADKMYDDAKAQAMARKEEIIKASEFVKNKATEIVKDILF